MARRDVPRTKKGPNVTDLIFQVLKLAIPFSVMVSMFAQGLSVHPGQLAIFRERPGLIGRSLGVVLVLVPAAVLGLVLLLKPARPVAIGLTILAACPAAPIMMVKVPKQGGSLAYVTILHLSLALLALFTVPITLNLLSQGLGFRIAVPMPAVAKVVGMTILAPVCTGILLRALFPKFAEVVGPTAARAGDIALTVLIFLLVAAFSPMLLNIDPWSYLVMGVVIAASLAIGHGLGPKAPEERTTLAIESAARHPGLALTIAVLSVSPRKALAVLIPYLVVFVVVSTLYLQWRKRSAGARFSTPGLTRDPEAFRH
jgi:bile acid:Na+ symporter, BASS family